jgi:hypothetical protein
MNAEGVLLRKFTISYYTKNPICDIIEEVKVGGFMSFGENNSFNATARIYHGGSDPVISPEIRITKYTKDFGVGFYCTDIKEQAAKWSIRRSVKGFISVFEYTPSAVLVFKKFKEDDEWLDFVTDCRNGKPHAYDIVEGPMADDQIWEFVDDYLAGNISREEFWAIAKFKYPTHQISFHTESALKSLKYINCEEVSRNV